MCHFRDGFQVSNLQLWVGQDFEKYAAGVIINGFAHGFDIGQIAQTHLYAKTAQSGYEQGISIAEEMLGCNNILPCAASAMRVLLMAAIPELKAVA